MSRIAIHGFGRIGRSLTKVALKQKLFVPVSLSDIKDIGTLAAFFEVNSNYERWAEDVNAENSSFSIGGREIPYFDSTKALPNWKTLGVDLVIDCTGRATTRQARSRERPQQEEGRLRSGITPRYKPQHIRSGETQDHQHG